MAFTSTLSSALPASLSRQELRHELQAFRGNLSNDIRDICDRLRESFHADLQRQLSAKQDTRVNAWKDIAVAQDPKLLRAVTETETRTVRVQPRQEPPLGGAPQQAELPRASTMLPKESAGGGQLRQAAAAEGDEDDEEVEISLSLPEQLSRVQQRRSRFDDAEQSQRWKTKRVKKKRSAWEAGAEVLSKARSTQYGKEQPHWALRIVENDYFDYVLIAFLLGNALTFGFQADVMARNSLNEAPVIFTALNIAFTILFGMELVIRLLAYQWSFFVGEGWKWNAFDLIIVCFSVIDELGGPQGASQALKSMVYLVSASMNSFFWTGVLLLLLMYCVAVYFTELATEAGRLNINDVKDLTDVRRYWGSMGQAVASLFQAITGGMDWRDCVEVFETALPESHDLLLAVFSLYIAFATLVMLNLVTGVFVEGAQRIAKEEKEQELVKSVRKLCKLADTSGDGEITWEEFEANLSSPEMGIYLKAFDMDSSQAKDIFYVLDPNDAGNIRLEEFIGASIKLHAPARMADREILRIYMRDCFAEINLRLQSMEELWKKRGKMDAA